MLGVGEVAVWVWRRAGEAAEYRAQVHAKVFEGAVFETAATFSVGYENTGIDVGRDTVSFLFGAAQLAITAHACIASIKSGRRGWIGSPLGPVVVGLIAIIAALIPERLLVGPCEESVPSEEVARIVHREGLLDVCCYEVIVTTSHAWSLCQRCLCL